MTANAPLTIGRYEVLDLLGQGGMGRVYLARDSVLGRKVAIKVLRDDLGLPPETRESLFTRMRNEARAAASLSHPHMVTLHDMGEEDPFGLYLVFEYVDGMTLRDRIADGPLASRDVAALARDLGSALDAAHAAGVIHRDVKPENVLIVRPPKTRGVVIDPQLVAKLTDFGIARLPDSTITRAGSILGTPAYSAPEALALGEFSAASDQFSLATTLYEAITGRRAFPGDDALAVAARIATEPPPPLGMIGSLKIDARTRARTELVLHRALSKDPKKRFASCRDLGDALGTALLAANDAVTPAITPMRMSLTPRARKTQNIVAAAGLITIALLIVLGRRTRTSGDGISMRDVADSFASSESTPHAPPITTRHEATHPAIAPHPTRESVHDAGTSPPADDHDATPSPAPPPHAPPTSADASSGTRSVDGAALPSL